MTSTDNYTMTRNLIDATDNVGALCAIIRSIPGGDTPDTPVSPEEYPSGGGAIAEGGTQVKSTIKRSSEKGIDFEIKTSVSAKGVSLEPTGVSPQPGNESGAVRYVVDTFHERPSEEVTQYELQYQGSWLGPSNVDTAADGKKGMRIHREILKTKGAPVDIVVKWEKANKKVYSTVRIKIDYSDLVLSDYTVTASSLEKSGTKVVLKIDKPLPEFMEYTIAGTQPDGELSVKATADGLAKELIVSETVKEGKYEVTAITAEHLKAEGLPKEYTEAAAAAAAAAAALPERATIAATAATKVTSTTTAKKASNKKTTTKS